LILKDLGNYPIEKKHDFKQTTAVKTTNQSNPPTILVVEDIEMVLRETSRTLRDAGYVVIEARDGQEALDIIASQAVEINLVLADVIMPKMDGMQLYRTLRRTNPELKVVLTSVISLPRYFWQEFPFCDFIKKSFDLSGLPSILKNILHPKELHPLLLEV
jgi:two-component system, cell cycle sensor histidine kinase and response regulator CckA